MGNSSASSASVGQPAQPLFKQIDPRGFKPHPRNSSIYGDDEDITELLKLITHSGWVKPLVLTPDYVIISGHRRWKAALELGLESVPVEVREFSNETAELEALLLENATRLKFIEQKVREAEAWEEVERVKAKGRQGTRTDIRENFPRCDSQRDTGRVREQVARRVGLGSGRTYEKAAKVVPRSDEEASLGHQEIAQVLRKTLNEQSVDAAHALLKRTPQELQAIANLITSGKAKSTRAAVKMSNQNHDADPSNTNCSDLSQPRLAGFLVGDWVKIESANEHNKTYVGQRGRIEQVLATENQVSVSFEGMTDKLRFEPHELSLLVRAAPANPIQVEDIVFIRIDRQEAASPQEKRWNGFWGKVTQIGEMGSLSVDVGSESFQLFSRDVKPVDSPSSELRQVAERVLRLRRLELDEVEEKMLDVLQRREWFTPRHLDYLGFMEKFYLSAGFPKTQKHQVVQFRGR